MLVVSYNFDNSIEGHKLADTCTKYGYKLKMLGEGHSFINFRQAKIDLLISELNEIKDSIIMFTDGLDSWFLSDKLEETYKKYFNNRVVVSGNRDHYPYTQLYAPKEYPIAPTSFRFICSSQFIGRRSKVIKVLETIRDNWDGITDQEGWNYCYAKRLIDIDIDYNCRLFLNMTNVNINELNSHVLKETGIKPCSIHFGGAKGDSPNGIAMRKYWTIC